MHTGVLRFADWRTHVQLGNVFQLLSRESAGEAGGQGLWQDNAGSYSGEAKPFHGQRSWRGTERSWQLLLPLSSSREEAQNFSDLVKVAHPGERDPNPEVDTVWALPGRPWEEPWDSGQVQSLWAFIFHPQRVPQLPGRKKEGGMSSLPLSSPSNSAGSSDSSEILPADAHGGRQERRVSFPSCLPPHVSFTTPEESQDQVRGCSDAPRGPSAATGGISFPTPADLFLHRTPHQLSGTSCLLV